MAVAVDDHDIPWLADRLDDNLIGRRRAVNAEVRSLGAERARRLFMRFFDVPGGLEQAVESTGGRRGLGEEQIHAVELAHVADPVRAEDRLAARHRQRMKRTDRTLRIA